MRLLAIDTTLAACAAAVYDTERGLVAHLSQAMVRGHAEALMPLIALVMTDAIAQFSEIDRIAVTVGPGSFTGLRVGVAAARGIALAAKKVAVGITTLNAFAAPHFHAAGTMPILSVVDARNGMVFMEIFEPDGRSRGGPQLATVADAFESLLKTPPRIVGNAAQLVGDAWPKWNLPAIVAPQAAPDIEWVARLGAERDASDSPPKPFYLRAPDAKPQNAARIPRQ